MRLPNNWGGKKISCHQMKLSSQNLLYLMELLVKTVTCESISNPGCCKDVSCSAKTDDKALRMRTTPTQLTERGVVSQAGPFIQPHPYVLPSLPQDGTLNTTNGETEKPTRQHNLGLQLFPACKIG